MDSCLKVLGGFCSLQTSPTSESNMSHLCLGEDTAPGIQWEWAEFLVTFRCGGDEMIKELKGLIFDHKIICHVFVCFQFDVASYLSCCLPFDVSECSTGFR